MCFKELHHLILFVYPCVFQTPPYPVSMQVNYNLSLHIWPCQLKRKNHTNITTTTTEFSVYVTYSAVSGYIFAFNKVGKSSQTHILIPAKNLTYPRKCKYVCAFVCVRSFVCAFVCLCFCFIYFYTVMFIP